MRAVLKRFFVLLFAALIFPTALISGFGRLPRVYTFFAHVFALGPGIIGDYFRSAYYLMTLEDCSIDARIGFGTFFAHREVSLKPYVVIGAFCLFGSVKIDDRTQIASYVQVLSGAHQHTRDASGRLEEGQRNFTQISIGKDCWVGANAIIMADIGDGATIGAGSVIGGPVAPNAVMMGNPARLIRAQVQSQV